MQFEYVAKDKTGKIVRGALEAKDRASASSSISKQELYIISVSSTKKKLTLLQRKPSLKDKIIFTEQLAVMLRSGLSVSEALKSLQEETENRWFAKEISSIVADVEGGTPLSTALARFPGTFSDIYINLVKAGENTGNLDEVLHRLTDQLEKDYELTRKIKGALSYPIFVGVALIIVMALVLVVIIPQLKIVFEDAGVELPIITQAIINLSLALKKYGLIAIALLVVLAVVLSRWLKTKAGRSFFDAAIVKVPVIGTLLKKSYMARFTRTFASLSSSGLPVLEALKISSRVIGNVHYQEEVEKMSLKIKNGASVSKTLKESSRFPKIIGQLSTAGEKSGNLGDVFTSLANFFDRDVESITSNLSSMLEPFLILILGIGIGTIIISVLQPIYGLVNAI